MGCSIYWFYDHTSERVFIEKTNSQQLAILSFLERRNVVNQHFDANRGIVMNYAFNSADANVIQICKRNSLEL